MPVRRLITKGTTADCTQAEQLIEGITAQYLLADKGYDSDNIIKLAETLEITPVIPPRKSKVEQSEYNADLYRLRYLVENALLHLKKWRGIATRYTKRADSFRAAVQIRCIVLWEKIILTTLSNPLQQSDKESLFSWEDRLYLHTKLDLLYLSN